MDYKYEIFAYLIF